MIGFLRALAGPLAASAVLGVILSVIAGTFRLPGLWALIAVMSILGVLTRLAIGAGEFQRRHKRGPDDVGRVTTALMRLCVLGTLTVAALDAGRFHWSSGVPLALRAGSLVIFGVTLGFGLWAVAVNRHYTHQLRIQNERDHQVITAGPYQFLRHPSYLGIALAMPAAALVMGSWWALITAVGIWGVIARRTSVEDQLLLAGLTGYREYSNRVRYRLIPGVW